MPREGLHLQMLWYMPVIKVFRRYWRHLWILFCIFFSLIPKEHLTCCIAVSPFIMALSCFLQVKWIVFGVCASKYLLSTPPSKYFPGKLCLLWNSTVNQEVYTKNSQNFTTNSHHDFNSLSWCKVLVKEL